jgi:predicted nucleotidyltransferase
MSEKPSLNGEGMMEVGVRQVFDPYAPPSPEQLKQQWADNYRNRPIEYERKADKNRRQAIKEILQDQVKQSVKPNDRLNDIFNKQIGK